MRKTSQSMTECNIMLMYFLLLMMQVMLNYWATCLHAVGTWFVRLNSYNRKPGFEKHLVWTVLLDAGLKRVKSITNPMHKAVHNAADWNCNAQILCNFVQLDWVQAFVEDNLSGDISCTKLSIQFTINNLMQYIHCVI